MAIATRIWRPGHDFDVVDEDSTYDAGLNSHGVRRQVVLYGPGGAALLKAEDSQHASGDYGMPVWQVRKDAIGTLVGTDGDYAPWQCDSLGSTRVSVHTAGGYEPFAVEGDTDGGSAANRPTINVVQRQFNAATFDRVRNNVAGTLLASAARTATASSADQTNYNHKGAILFIDFTATPNNAETATLSIEEKDPISGKYVAVTAFTALTSSALGATPTTETYLYTLYPGGAETAAVAKHEVQGLALARTWRATVTLSAAGSWTFSVGFSMLP